MKWYKKKSYLKNKRKEYIRSVKKADDFARVSARYAALFFNQLAQAMSGYVPKEKEMYYKLKKGEIK